MADISVVLVKMHPTFHPLRVSSTSVHVGRTLTLNLVINNTESRKSEVALSVCISLHYIKQILRSYD